MTSATLENLLESNAAFREAIVALTVLAREDEQLRLEFTEAEAEAHGLHYDWRSAAAHIERMRLLLSQIEASERATLTTLKALLAGQYGHLA